MERRDPYKLKHKMTVGELYKVAPDFDWNAFFRAVRACRSSRSSTSRGPISSKSQTQMKSASAGRLEDLSALARGAFAGAVSVVGVRQGEFRFLPQVSAGSDRLPPRWKRCVQYTDNDLGEALGQVYVQQDILARIEGAHVDMTQQIEDAMASASSSWIG